jgi:hypothetical protein
MGPSDAFAYMSCACLHNVCVKENRREQHFIRFRKKEFAPVEYKKAV